jgi:hypothetical protein
MDEQTLAIQPFKAPADEKFGIRDPEKGQRRCVVIVPKKSVNGNPWSWRGCYWDHQPQTEIELLQRGFHIAYISANANLKPGREWDAWYTFLTETHGLSKKPAFVGMSRGGEYAYDWATAHPENVSCIYADNPGADREMLEKLGDLARQDVPLLHVCGSIDPLLGKSSNVIESVYQQFGGRISVMIKEGYGHHPHSLKNPRPIADFIEQSFIPPVVALPAYAVGKVTHSAFYGDESVFRNFPDEGTYITCRGPAFGNCYDRYIFGLPEVEGSITTTAPKTPAAGMPWVFRSDFVGRDAAVDLALLAKGFHIVTGPVPYNADRPNGAHWAAVYKHLVEHGFSKKPVMEGAGGSAVEAFLWATANPEKVSCIYTQNPVLESTMLKSPTMDRLSPVAKAGIPLIVTVGRLDPALADNATVLETRYKEMGGSIKVMIIEGRGHFLNGAFEPGPVVDAILKVTRRE